MCLRKSHCVCIMVEITISARPRLALGFLWNFLVLQRRIRCTECVRGIWISAMIVGIVFHNRRSMASNDLAQRAWMARALAFYVVLVLGAPPASIQEVLPIPDS